MRTFKNIISVGLILCACTAEEKYTQCDTTSLRNNILVFGSKEELLNSINGVNNSSVWTKGGDNNHFNNLFSLLKEIDVNMDPIISYEIKDYEYEEGDEAKTLYQILGYDELVPNENFARLLNTHGEFQVGDIIYKVSPKGTYFFKEDALDEFESGYSDFEEKEGEIVAERTYQLSESIFLYDSFTEDNPDNWLITKACPIPGFDNYPCDTYTGDVNLLLNNQVHYKEMSSNRRLKTRVYNHDYIVYQERGAYAKVQKKVTIGWKDIVASELSLGWNNIIMTRNYEMGMSQPLPGSSPVWLGTVTETFNGNQVIVAEVSAYSIPANDYGVIVNGTKTTLFSKIYNDTGIFIMNCDAVRLYGFDKVQLITAPQYIMRQSAEEVKVEFTNNVLAPCYKFAAGQFFFVGKDGSLVGALRVGTDFPFPYNP